VRCSAISTTTRFTTTSTRARDMLLMSHLQESIHSADVANPDFVQSHCRAAWVVCVSDQVLIKEAQSTLQDIFTTQRRSRNSWLRECINKRYQVLTARAGGGQRKNSVSSLSTCTSTLNYWRPPSLSRACLFEIPLFGQHRFRGK